MNNHNDDLIDEDDLILEDEDTLEDEDEAAEDQDLLDDEDDDPENVQGDENDDEEIDDEEDPEAPAWENKRIKKMAERHKVAKARIKELESENARLTEITGTEDPQLYASIADKLGILPRFISTADAKKIAEARELRERIQARDEILDEIDDKGETFYEDANGKTWQRAEIKRQKRDAEKELAKIAKVADRAEKTARKQMIILLNAGLKALRSQKNEAAERKKKRQVATARKPSRVRYDDDGTAPRTRSRRPTARDDYPLNNAMSERELARAKLRRIHLSQYAQR